MMNEGEPNRKRRWWLLLIAVPLCLVAGVLVYNLAARSSLNNLTATLDLTDPGWRLEDIEAARADYPPERNAAVKVLAVKALETKSQNLEQNLDSLLWPLDPPKLLNEQQLDALRKLMAQSTAATAEARTMIGFPHGRHAIVWSPDWISTILKCQDNRDANYLLKNDALMCAQNGDADGALRASHAQFHCGSSIGDEPMLISQLVRVACQASALYSLERVLAQGSPSEDGLAAFQKRLEESDAEPLLWIACRGERAGLFRLLEYIRDGNMPRGGFAALTGGGVPGGTGGIDVMAILCRLPGFLSSQTVGCIRYMNGVVDIARQPPEEWTAKFAAIRQNANDLPVLAKLLAPATDKVAQAVQRSHAHQRCALVAIACERFRKKHDRWPNSLDELKTAGFLKAIPNDPYVGGPLKFKRTAEGLLIYTTGLDSIDDGGKFDRQNPTGAGTDFGFGLWDADKRRQPPPPPVPIADPSKYADINATATPLPPSGAPK